LRNLVIEHRALECVRPFDEVHSALVGSLPALKPELSGILARGEKDKVEHARRDGPKLWLFLARNHGELTAAEPVCTPERSLYGIEGRSLRRRLGPRDL
jgi:hypothetical protein